MKARILIALTTLAFLGLSISVPALAGKDKNCDPNIGDVHPSCEGGGGGETSAEYTAALTAGGFIFGPVDVTPNGRDNGYTSALLLDMSRPEDETAEADAWDDVFLACSDVLGSTPISGVTVGTDWGITQGGKKNSSTTRNVRITFRSVVADGFEDVGLWFALISWAPENPRSDFLPAPGEKSIYILDTAKIYGDDIDNHTSCNSGEFLLLEETRLEICHKDENGDGCG